MSPEFDLPPCLGEDDRPRKRGRREHSPMVKAAVQYAVDTLGDDEALALTMLRVRT